MRIIMDERMTERLRDGQMHYRHREADRKETKIYLRWVRSHCLVKAEDSWSRGLGFESKLWRPFLCTICFDQSVCVSGHKWDMALLRVLYNPILQWEGENWETAASWNPVTYMMVVNEMRPYLLNEFFFNLVFYRFNDFPFFLFLLIMNRTIFTLSEVVAIPIWTRVGDTKRKLEFSTEEKTTGQNCRICRLL